jgi:hypothetical protein
VSQDCILLRNGVLPLTTEDDKIWWPVTRALNRPVAELNTQTCNHEGTRLSTNIFEVLGLLSSPQVATPTDLTSGTPEVDIYRVLCSGNNRCVEV